MSQVQHSFDLDLIVIGGGSGGLAAAKEAAALNAKVVCFDFVRPSTQGTKWGLGGTCVNVGCIPKKLFHHSARFGLFARHAAKKNGWDETKVKFNWEKMIETVNNYIRQLNFMYRSGLRKAGVEYINAEAYFIDDHTVGYEIKGEKKRLTARYILIAVGGRPYIPADVENGLKYGISSDDLFWRKESPGKILLVGASYIAFECAGFLLEFDLDVTMCVRSLVLRGFDRQCSEKLGQIMLELGCKFKMELMPSKIERLDNGKLEVLFSDGTKDQFDTVMFATGRAPVLEYLRVENTGLKLCDSQRKKFVVDEYDRTNIEHIFALGDAACGRPELTPTAIKTGELLARRLFGQCEKLMNYMFVPTVVFTPIEYGCIGYSEEAAIEKYGMENIEVYLSEFNSLQVAAFKWEKVEATRTEEFDTTMQASNLSKLVVEKATNRVVGFHCVGLDAGETTHGYALALSVGVTKEDFDDLVCIHPTDAESFHQLSITRASGANWVSSSGCGGGKCG